MSNTVVRTNGMALNSHRNLGMVGKQQATASQRLSSGFRINNASDDAAGLGISEKMRAQIRGLDQASRNSADGISLIQTAEGALGTVNEILMRVRELVVQASNDTNVGGGEGSVTSDRVRIQDEIDQLMSEIDSIAENTEFNTRKLLDGSLNGVSGQFLGRGPSETRFELSAAQITEARFGAASAAFEAQSAAQLEAISAAQVALSATMSALSSGFAAISNSAHELMTSVSTALVDAFTDVSTSLDSAATALRALDMDDIAQALEDGVTDIKTALTAALDALKATFSSTVETAAIEFNAAMQDAVDTFQSALKDAEAAGIAARDAEFQKAIDEMYEEKKAEYEPTSNRTGDSLWFQTGANADQGIFVNIGKMSTGSLFNLNDNHTTENRIIDVTSQKGHMVQKGVKGDRGSISGQESALDALDAALSETTRQRSVLGATQNRLEFTIQNLDTASENLSSANSRIRDADMAKEMMTMTQSNVLQQAAISMLSQANQAPQNVLQLLG